MTYAELFTSIDERWARALDTLPKFKLARPRRSDFEALVRSIVFQQLAGKAAASIYDRLAAAVQLDPSSVARARMTTLRNAGLSEAKAKAIKGLARAADSGELDLPALRRAGDDDVEHALTALHGVGPWTAHMYLIFHLRRPDVWPTGDYGVRVGFRTLFELDELPTPRALIALGEPYRPHRSAVAWYCWRTVENGRAPAPRSGS